MSSRISEGKGRFRLTVAGVLGGIGLALAIPAGASAANVDCSGKIIPAAEGNGLAYTYNFLCGSPEGDATQVDAYSIISNKAVSGFGVDALVYKSDGSVVPDQAFACEGPIPSEGFGCFGKASLYNTIEGGFTLLRNPCSNKSRRKGAWRMWVVASAAKINPVTGAKTPAVSEPLRLRVPACTEKAAAKPKHG